MEEALADMELLGPGKDDSVPVKTRVAESFGVVVRMFPSEENLVYEIKESLRQDSLCKYAIDIGNDSLLTIAFESTVRDADAGRGQGEGGGGNAQAWAAAEAWAVEECTAAVAGAGACMGAAGGAEKAAGTNDLIRMRWRSSSRLPFP